MDTDPADPSQSQTQMESSIVVLISPEIKDERVDDGFVYEGLQSQRSINVEDNPTAMDTMEVDNTDQVTTIKIEDNEIGDIDQNVPSSFDDSSTRVYIIKVESNNLTLGGEASTLCEYCGRVFDTNENLQKHIELAHVRHAEVIERGQILYDSSKETATAAAGSSKNIQNSGLVVIDQVQLPDPSNETAAGAGTGSSNNIQNSVQVVINDAQPDPPVSNKKKRGRPPKKKKNIIQDPAISVVEIVTVDEIAPNPSPKPKKRLVEKVQEKLVDVESNSFKNQAQKIASEKKEIELKDFIHQLQQQMGKLEEINYNLSSQLTELSNEHESLVLNHDEVIQEKTILSQQFDQFVNDSSEEKDRLNSINSQLMMEISSKKENIEKIQGQFEESKKCSEEMEIKVSELNDKYDEIRHENLEIQEKLTSLRQEKEKEIKNLILANKETCKLFNGQIIEGEKQKLADKNTIESLLGNQKGSEEIISQLKTEISSKNNKIKKIQQKFEKLNKSTEEMEKMTCELNDKINKLEEINSSLILDTNNNIKELRETNSDLFLKLDDLGKEMESEKVKFNTMLNANQATIQDIQDEKMTSEKKQLELKDFINQLQQQMGKLDENNSKLSSQLSELSNEHESLVLNRNEMIQEKIILNQKFEQFVKDSNEEISRLNSINSKLMMEISSKKENVDVIESKFGILKKCSEEMEIKISELNDKYDVIWNEKAELQKKFTIVSEDKDKKIEALILANVETCKSFCWQIKEGDKQKLADKDTIESLLVNQKEAEELISKQMAEILSKNSQIEELKKSTEEMEKRACELNDKYDEIHHENMKLEKKLNGLREKKEEIENLILEGDKQKITDKHTFDGLLENQNRSEEVISQPRCEISSKNNKIEELNKSTEEIEMEYQMSELNNKIEKARKKHVPPSSSQEREIDPMMPENYPPAEVVVKKRGGCRPGAGRKKFKKRGGCRPGAGRKKEKNEGPVPSKTVN